MVRMGKVMPPRLFPVFTPDLLPWMHLLSSQQFSSNSLSCNCFFLLQICSVSFCTSVWNIGVPDTTWFLNSPLFVAYNRTGSNVICAF